MNGQRTRPHCELTFSPNVELISVVRRFVSAFYDQILEDPDTASRLAVATHELLENACKYASDGKTTLSIEFIREGAGVRIVLSNRAAPEQIADLSERFVEMAECPDPDLYYQRMMTRSMKQKSGSGLGLARIRAEAEMTLAFRCDGDCLYLIAETHTGSRGAAEVAS